MHYTKVQENAETRFFPLFQFYFLCQYPKLLYPILPRHLSIILPLPQTGRGRMHLREALRMDERLEFRTNLDPEIVELLKD